MGSGPPDEVDSFLIQGRSRGESGRPGVVSGPVHPTSGSTTSDRSDREEVQPMEDPRPEKVAVVDEVRERFERAEAVLFTEYRGLTVSELSELRSSMRAAGGDYRIYKNTLVRFATRSLDLEVDDQLTGPTALAFVSTRPDGAPGDVAAVAKALSDFAKANPLLAVKGGILGDAVLDAAGARALASLPTAAEIYARIAGGLNSGARGLAGAISGVHRSIAYVLQAAIDAGAFAGEAAPATTETAEAPAAEAAAEPTEAPAAEPDEASAAAPADEAAEPDPTPEAESTEEN
jgi:large subunit ribosomal protein L10